MKFKKKVHTAYSTKERPTELKKTVDVHEWN